MTFGSFKGDVMGNSHYCETCAKICDEAKKNIKKLEKKVQTLSIVCAVSITLLGEHGGKALYDALYTFVKSKEIVDGKEGKKEDTKQDGNKDQKDKPNQIGKVGFGGWKQPYRFGNQNSKESADPNKALEGLIELAKKNIKKKEEPQLVAVGDQANQIVQAATTNNQDLQMPEQFIPRFATTSDPYAVFLTPSAMPFDVYSTTLGLGNNYGFGEYYGMDTSNYSGSSTPTASTLSVFALGTAFKTRKRI